MSAEQRILGLRVIETADLDPGLDAVAGLTAKRASVAALPRHLVGEFALVRVRMAGGAASVRKVKGQNLVGATVHARFVAIRAGNRSMSTRERKARVRMFCNGVGGAVPILDAVAAFATVTVGSHRELVVVRILVTVRAGRELHLVNCIVACRNVALRTRHLSVLALQRILSVVVFLNGKKRRLPAVDGVAVGTLAFLWTSSELAFVGIA